MKKFISFVMAGAMVASLVPATAFAKNGDVTATAKIVDALEKDKSFGDKNGDDGVITKAKAPELQLKVTSVDYTITNPDLANMDVELTLDNAEYFTKSYSSMSEAERNDAKTTLKSYVSVVDKDNKLVLGVSREDTGASVTVGDAPAAFDTVGEIAQAIFDKEELPENLAFYKVAVPNISPEDYTFIKATEFAANNDVDEEKDTPTLATRRDAAFGVAIAAKNIAITAGGAITASNWSTYYSFGTVFGADAYVLNGTTGSDLTNPPQYVLVSEFASSIAPAEKYTETEIVGQIAAKLTTALGADAIKTVTVIGGGIAGSTLSVAVKDFDKDSVTYTFSGFFKKDDKITFDLASKLTKTSEGTKATVSVDSKMVTADDLVYASILGKGLKASIKKTVDVATDEVVTLNGNGLKIETAVGNFAKDQVITLKLSNGFEFVEAHMGTADFASVGWVDEREIKLTVTADGKDEIVLKDTQIEATSAKSGAVATITVKSSNNDSATVEVAKVVDYKVSLTVDADEDVPVIYSGTNVANYGLTDDSDHVSLEVTAKETFPGAWSMRQGFNFNLPEGVYVTEVKVTGAENFKLIDDDSKTASAQRSDWEKAFKKAYQDGDHKNFEFKKRVFNDVDTKLEKDPAELTFELVLVADPTFEGDVKLTFEGALVDKQEVTIAKFVKPYTVKAEQNDVIIDYRNTDVKTPIVVTEAEEGLWKKDTAQFKFNIEKGNITFEDDPTFTVDADSDMKLKDDKADKGLVKFTVKEESDKAATVTISDMKLFMERNIPAGGYDLEIETSINEAYKRQVLLAPDQAGTVAVWALGKDRPSESDVKKDSYVDDVADFSDVAKAAFINVVTSGRDNDNLFTTKVVVPVGEAYIVAGEAQVALDVPAYISAAGYTMLPIRAVSKALGVDTNNVLWSAETKTITIMYAQRIITMTVGQKTVYVNGSAIPTSAAPEIKDGRAFLPLRDLGTALGVTNVTWDAATKTATLN